MDQLSSPAQYNIPTGNIPTSINPQLPSNPSGSLRNQASSSYSNYNNAASASLGKFKNNLDSIRGKRINDNPYKNILNDPTSFLKQQKLPISRSQVITLLIPVISKFTKADFITNLLIKKLVNETKQQLKNKGTLSTSGLAFTFVPSNPGNYSVYKSNFDKKVSNLKKSVDKLKEVTNILLNVIKILNISLSVTQLYLKYKLNRLRAKLVKVTADLASPSPSKSSGADLLTIVNDILKIQKYEKNIEKYKNIINMAQLFLTIFKQIISDIQNKLNELSLTIQNNPLSGVNSSNELTNNLNKVNNYDSDEDYIDNFGKSYILKLVTLPNGTKQYQAIDAFSKMKITQTAPSRIKTSEQLLEEIKQILG